MINVMTISVTITDFALNENAVSDQKLILKAASGLMRLYQRLAGVGKLPVGEKEAPVCRKPKRGR
jgi:hypothetical protein